MKSKFEKIVIATTNKGKFEEITKILYPILNNIKFLSLNEFPKIQEPEENGKTFFENALIKAKYYYSKLGIPVITDDSGLEVEALNGEPGVYSSRYAGPNSTQKDLIEKLLKNMKDKTNRNARFVCCAVFLYEKDKFIFSEGIVEGIITTSPKGTYGFGYDPIFIPKGYNKTFAELGPEIKNQISHRKQAFQKLATKIKIELDV